MTTSPPPSFTYTDVSKVPSKLICSICEDPATDPRIHAPCKTMYCLRCITDWLTGCPISNCPQCRGVCDVDSLERNDFIEAMLNEIEVTCAHQKFACNWRGHRSDSMAHQRVCAFLPCAHTKEGCKVRGSAAELKKHVREHCQFADVMCPEGCTVSLARRFVIDHVQTKCVVVKQRRAEAEAEAHRQKLAAQQREEARLAQIKAEEARQKAEALRRAEEEKALKEKLRLQALVAECAALNPVSEDVLSLDIGGTLFRTSRSTLMKYPTSLLAILISEQVRKLQRNAEGVVLLDAHAGSFAYILAWLQDGVIPRGLTDDQADLLLKNAKKWGLQELEQAWRSQPLSQTRLGQYLEISRRTNAQLTDSNTRVDGVSRLSLPRVNLQGVYLANAQLTGSNFAGADLRQANLAFATLKQCNLSGADLRDADLSGADLSGADLTGAHLKGVKMLGCTLSNINFSSCDLSGVDFTKANLTRVNFAGVSLKEVNFAGSFLNGVNFTSCDLSGQDSSGRDISDVNFTEANLTCVNFAGCTNFRGTLFTKAILNQALFSSDRLDNSTITREQLHTARVNTMEHAADEEDELSRLHKLMREIQRDIDYDEEQSN